MLNPPLAVNNNPIITMSMLIIETNLKLNCSSSNELVSNTEYLSIRLLSKGYSKQTPRFVYKSPTICPIYPMMNAVQTNIQWLNGLQKVLLGELILRLPSGNGLVHDEVVKISYKTVFQFVNLVYQHRVKLH